MSCNHVFTSSLQLLYAPLFPWVCQIYFSLSTYLMGLPDMWQPLIVVQTCSEKAALLAMTNTNDCIGLYVLGGNLCFHSKSNRPWAYPNCWASPGCALEVWRFGGLGMVGPQCIYCIWWSPMMWKTQGINLVSLHHVFPEEYNKIE